MGEGDHAGPLQARLRMRASWGHIGNCQEVVEQGCQTQRNVKRPAVFLGTGSRHVGTKIKVHQGVDLTRCAHDKGAALSLVAEEV